MSWIPPSPRPPGLQRPSSNPEAVAPAERIHAIDVVRGAALGGVLLANLLGSFRMPTSRGYLPPDETAPWTICITNGATQFLYTTDQEPGRLYKLTLEGRIVGMLGESGRDAKQFNWVHGIACPSDDVLYLADMNNWRVQKITLHPERMTKTATRSR